MIILIIVGIKYGIENGVVKMKINIIKFENRKLYIRAIDNAGLRGTSVENYIGRYINLSELKPLISEFDVTLKVICKKTGKDLTKETLLGILKADLFSERDLYSLVKKQSLCQSVLNKYVSENAFYRNGIEL